MKYSTLSLDATEGSALQRLRGQQVSIRHLTVERGDGPEVDLGPIGRVTAWMRSTLADLDAGSTQLELDQLEGQFGAHLHRSLSDVPIEVLDDAGFWRFLTMEYFWDFVAARESLTEENVAKYSDCRSFTEAVVPRAYLRAQAIANGDDYSLAFALRGATDFWRSHVVRVRTGSAPNLARALAIRQRDHRMPTDVLRPFARRLNRTWTNVVLHVYDEADAEQLIAELGDPST